MMLGWRKKNSFLKKWSNKLNVHLTPDFRQITLSTLETDSIHLPSPLISFDTPSFLPRLQTSPTASFISVELAGCLGHRLPQEQSRVRTRPWQRSEAAGLVARLFCLAAHALYDPEDYWLNACRAKCVFSLHFPWSNSTCKQNKKVFSFLMHRLTASSRVSAPITNSWCGFMNNFTWFASYNAAQG